MKIAYCTPLHCYGFCRSDVHRCFFWLDRFTQYCEGNLGNGWTTAGKKGTLPFSEILAVEFMRWQELGIIDISKDSAKIFITNMIDSMKKQSR